MNFYLGPYLDFEVIWESVTTNVLGCAKCNLRNANSFCPDCGAKTTTIPVQDILRKVNKSQIDQIAGIENLKLITSIFRHDIFIIENFTFFAEVNARIHSFSFGTIPISPDTVLNDKLVFHRLAGNTIKNLSVLYKQPEDIQWGIIELD